LWSESDFTKKKEVQVLRDDAIRQGKLVPNEKDQDRMKLTKKDVAKIRGKNRDIKQGINRGHN